MWVSSPAPKSSAFLPFEPVRDGCVATSFTLEFDDPQFAISPGQSVVIYDGQRLLGGGFIPINCYPRLNESANKDVALVRK
jgi:tRNA methyl transferase